MDNALAYHSKAKCYIDYVLIYSKTLEEHLAHIRKVFDMIATVNQNH